MDIKRTGNAGDPPSFTPEESDAQTPDVSQPGITGAFDEFTDNHSHGTMGSSVGISNGDLFSVYDNAAGYYESNEIKLVREDAPTDDRATTSDSPDDRKHKP